VWEQEGELAFQTICSIVANTCSLCIPLPSDEFSLVTDASGLGIGGVLQVKREDRWEAAAFFSRQLRGAEQRYSATEMEALAMVASIEHFSYYLYGREFKIFTDHKPLLQLLTSDRLNPRLRRLAFKLQHWMVEVEYLSGQDNTFADALSREERSREQIEKGETMEKVVYGNGLMGKVENEKEYIGVKRTTGSRLDVHLARGDVEERPPL